MPQPTPWHARGKRPDRWKSLAAGVLLTLFAAGWITAGVLALVSRIRADAAAAWLAPVALVLLGLGALQARLAWRLWREHRLSQAADTIFRPTYGCWLAAGVVIGYVAALAVGPVPHVGLIWLVVVAVCNSLLMLPLAAPPKIVDDWRRWLQDRTPRRLAWLVYAPLLVFVAGEATLRVERLVRESGFSAQSPRFEDFFAANAVAAESPFDLSRLKAGRFRVAVLGGDPHEQPQQLCRRVAGVLPGAEIIPLCGPPATSAAGQLDAAVEEWNPDLVLVVLPVCEDLAHVPAARHPFNWRHLEWSVRMLGEVAEGQGVEPAAAADFETFLSELGPQLAACRTPIDETIRAQWQRVYTSLDELTARCRAAEVPLALVVVPSEFQVNAALRETLLRRHGVAADQFDVELPQRRLAGYAQHRQLPLIDLLPHLRLCREAVYERNAMALNDHGNQAAASAIGGWLHSRYGGELTAQLSKAPQRN